MKTSIWKIMGLFGFVASWAQKALQPDEDGKVRITIDELADLADGMCDVFGWKAEIVVPEEVVEVVDAIPS